MTYEETCDYLFNQTTNFESKGQGDYKPGLESMQAIDEHFGSPHKNYKTIHVAGTNGKGSVSHSIAAQLQVCGYRVGLYTSPHLVDFSERIRVNGHPIDKDYVVSFVARNKDFFEKQKATFFEVATAMAFEYFSDMDVDFAVVEVGLGGRLDSTNIITPLLSVITNISLDHTQLLGTTLEQIAMEKAGIIKKGVPVVIGETLPETRPVFDAVAAENEATVIYAEDFAAITDGQPLPEGGICYQTSIGTEFVGELSGSYQVKNMNTVLHAVHVLMMQGYFCDCKQKENLERIGEEMRSAYGNVTTLTGLMGRWQIIKQKPLVVCDTGHNVGAWEYLGKQIEQTPHAQLHIVFGMVEDKDVYGVMSLLPKTALYYFTKGSTKRAMPEQSLQVFGAQLELAGMCYPTVEEAYQDALKNASPDDLIFIGGSTYVVADFLKNRV